MTKKPITTSTDKQRCAIVGAMMGVEQKISKLAPHPDRPGHDGPVFVKRDMRCAAGDERDTMLGCLLAESFFGAALGEMCAEALNVPTTVRELDWGSALEIYDEYRTDRANDNGHYALGNTNSVNGTFNRLSSPPVNRFAAWGGDLAQRKELEQAYASYSRQLDQLEALDINVDPWMAQSNPKQPAMPSYSF